jgi:hypothetical protein
MLQNRFLQHFRKQNLVKSMEGVGLFAAVVGFQVMVAPSFRSPFVSRVHSFSTEVESQEPTKKVKKSPIYTRTGDKGTTSVRLKH